MQTCPCFKMDRLCALLIILIIVIALSESRPNYNLDLIRSLVIQWAPLIWLHSDERFFPSDVESSLENFHVAKKDGEKIIPLYYRIDDVPATSNPNDQPLYLVTKRNIDYLLGFRSFLHGFSPKESSVPVYAVIRPCTEPHQSRDKNDDGKLDEKLFFTVDYWTWYPYNEGKKLCFIGKIPSFKVFGTCLGRMKTLASHVGDWEHVSLSFRGNQYPSELFLAIHEAGGYYSFNADRGYFKLKSVYQQDKKLMQKPKLPKIVDLQNGHPILFAAKGSHGLWPSPGTHEFVKVPRLTDACDYGSPWKTWHNVRMFDLSTSGEKLPNWMTFGGKWGNPKTDCIISERLNICEHVDGPGGILRNSSFQCH